MGYEFRDGKMSRLTIGVPILMAFLALFLMKGMFDSSQLRQSVVADNEMGTKHESEQSIEPASLTYALTTTLYPDASATMVYTSAGGTIVNLYFPLHATDITRTMALITHTTLSRPGFLIGEFAFSLHSIGGGVYDGYFVNFFAPVSLTIHYDDSFIPMGIAEAEAQMEYIQWWGEWRLIEETCYPPQQFLHDEENNIISGLICRPALYAYVGTHSQYLPVVFQN